MIHTTIGVYPDGSFKTNGVSSENLATHIWYNTKFRPGRTLYVDGVLIYRGIGFSDDLMIEWGEGLDAAEHIEHTEKSPRKGKAASFKKLKDTAPYH